MGRRVRIVAVTLTLLLALASVAGARMNPMMLGGGVVSPPPNYFLHDTFTEVTNTIITSHSPEVGSAWVFDTTIGTSSTTVIASDDAAMQTANEASFVYNTVSPATADYSVSTKTAYHVYNAAYTSTAGPCVRMTADGGGYCLRFEPSNFRLTLFRKNGSDTTWYVTNRSVVTLDSFTVNTYPSYYILTLTANGSSIVGTLKDSAGVLLGTSTATDSTYSASGYPGIFLAPTQVQRILEVYAE